MKTKDGLIKTEREVRALYPLICFAESTYAELGWQDYTPPTYAPTLDEAKTAKRAEIDAARHAANTAHFDYNGVRISCDALSRSDIDGVADHISLHGALPADFPGAWKGRDPVTGAVSWLPILSIEDFKVMHAAMVAEGTANFARSEARKAAIAAALTVAEVQAVVW